MATIYHSAFGGDLVFEENETLEHADKNPGMFGNKDTGRDRYTRLQSETEKINKKIEKGRKRLIDGLNEFTKETTKRMENLSDKEILTAMAKNDAISLKFSLGGKSLTEMTGPIKIE